MVGYRTGSWLMAFPLVMGMAFSPSTNATMNVTFDGELVDRPCQVSPESNGQLVTLLTRPIKDFWVAPGRGPREKFSIKLINCDPSIHWKLIKLKFNGTKEMGMEGQSDYFLKVTGDNRGKLAIGILDIDGKTLMKLGDAHNNKRGTLIGRPYPGGATVFLNFYAVVQATPKAIADKSVVAGEYTSLAQFEVFYE